MLSEQTRATLLRLADFAPTIPLKEWDLETWWCGTRGCLIGNAITKGILPGLRLDYFNFGGLTHWLVPYTSNQFGQYDHFDAVAEALGLPKKDALNLFGPDPVPDEEDGEGTRQLTRAEMAENIRDYVARNS